MLNIKFKIGITFVFILLLGFLIPIGAVVATQVKSGSHHIAGSTNIETTDQSPTQYGVMIPEMNMYTTMSVKANNRGTIDFIKWDGSPGTVTGFSYSSDYFNKDKIDGTLLSSNSMGAVNPWDTEWINVTGENETTNFNINAIANQYAMNEEESLVFNVNRSAPIEILIMISSKGPKTIKYQFSDSSVSIDSVALISPSNKQIPLSPPNNAQYLYLNSFATFKFQEFVAYTIGEYRLLLVPTLTSTTSLTLKIENPTSISTLSGNQLSYIGMEETPTFEESEENDWQSNWVRITGNSEKAYTLFFEKVFQVNSVPQINLWIPTLTGFNPNLKGESFSQSLYFGDYTDVYYVSITDMLYGSRSNYRYSLNLREMPNEVYSIGSSKEVKVSYDDEIQIRFNMGQSAFVRFNFTSNGDGAPTFDTGIPPNIYYYDSNSINGYSIRQPLLQKIFGGNTFYYYYLPEGDYILSNILYNTVKTNDGFMYITSKIVENAANPVPINELTYPQSYPINYETYQFNPSSIDPSLKGGKLIDLPITETGQYRINISMEWSDNSMALPGTALPAKVITFNGTDYFDVTTNATTQGPSFKAMELIGDRLYIAYTDKWHNMEINLTQAGTYGGYLNTAKIFDETSELDLSISSDTTRIGGLELRQNGTIVLNLGDSDFLDWKKGTGNSINIPNVVDSDYYWLALECDDAFFTTLPLIDLITLSNITMHGDLNFALIGESGYEYGDVWDANSGLYQIVSIDDIILNQGSGYKSFSEEQWLLTDGTSSTDPQLIGLDEGTYKLLIVPEKWSYDGSITIRVALENYWPYKVEDTYATIGSPNLYGYQINNYTLSGYAQANGTIYPYQKTISYNHTEHTLMLSSDESYVLVECTGTPYAWTQLVVAYENISNYELYLLQDLPWISSSGPNQEVRELGSGIGSNTTYEFGVITGTFYLLFEVETSSEMIELNLDLNQYTTPYLNITVTETAQITPPVTQPFDWIGLVIIVGAVGMVALIGAVGYYYIRSRGGKIKSKSPR